ncbi:MAG: hypothetical protein QOE77_2726 [Blastocatellia bacterium]|jgi:LmbE family N-acetylglucosaminyl deacetylase|nr:hypothetical protein [Blastocatellia bacterium]
MKRNTQVVLHLSRILLALLCAGVVISAPRAQQAAQTTQSNNADRVALYQALLDLTNPWTVMCIAAHPDDEDGTSLIVMRHKYGAHTVSLFSTFGEGGQNAIGPELYEELGAIRATETMAAAEIQGSEPHFLGLKDFGYSKSADEAFRVWGHDEALRRMVLQIRKLRPDVVITNHSATNNDHGHHQATARLELEAFDAAADAKRFAEQLKDGLTTWQVQRLFVRAGRSAQTQTANSQVVTIDPNELDPIRATIVAAEALRALQQHATQGPWPKTLADMARARNSPDGKLPVIRYVLTREATDRYPLTKDSHNFLDGMQLPDNVAKEIAPPLIDGKPLTQYVDQRDRLLAVLLATKKERYTSKRDQTGDPARTSRMAELLDSAIGTAAGLEISIAPVNSDAVPNSTAEFLVTLSNRGSSSPFVIATHSGVIDERKERFIDVIDKRPYQIPPGKTETFKFTHAVPATEPLTLPRSEHLYDERLFRQSGSMNVALKLQEVGFNLKAQTSFNVAPAVEITNIMPSPFVLPLPKAQQPATVRFQLINHRPRESDVSVIASTSYRQFTAKDCKFQLRPFEHRSVACVIEGLEAPIQSSPNAILGSYDVTLGLRDSQPGPLGAKKFRAVWAGALVAPNLKVGYIRGFDYSVRNALTALGVESKELTVGEIKRDDLQQYSAIIVDNRVYESQPELIAANQRLLDYAKEGGTLIVFYHKSNEWNPDPRRNRPQLAPYSIILGDERVTDENAAVTFEDSGHPLLNVPNKLQRVDFEGWIQERGLYYPKEWDANYYALLSMADPDENSLKGGLLVADYGSGHYIYTSMVWYRQLRAGVPGAYRMLANMISYGKTKQ